MHGSFYSWLLLLFMTVRVCCQHCSLRGHRAKRRVFSHKNIIIIKNNSGNSGSTSFGIKVCSWHSCSSEVLASVTKYYCEMVVFCIPRG